MIMLINSLAYTIGTYEAEDAFGISKGTNS